MKRLLLFLLLIVVPPIAANAQSQAPSTTFVAFMLTSEEQLANYASSRGYANFTLSADHQRLDYQVVFWSIQDPTQAHIHVGERGVDGPPAKDLQIIDGRYARGTWSASDEFQPLTAALVDSLMAGKLYVNVHTLLNPSGEIRGQIFQPRTYVALASGANETPAVSPAGNGLCVVAVDAIDTLAFIRGQADNMSSTITAAHLHQAPVGTPGPVVKPTPMIYSALDSLSAETMLNWSTSDSSNPMTLNLLNSLEAENLYWNVHTELHPGGEIRGQLQRGLLAPDDSGVWFMAILSGPQEGESGKPSNGTGTAVLHLSPHGDTAYVVAFVADMDAPVIGAHIHHGFIGEVPPNNVVVEIPTTLHTIWTSSDPVHPLGSADIDSLFAGEYYINIHTSVHPDGEIRGQLLPMSSRAEIQSSVARINPTAAGISVYPNPSSTSVRLQIGDTELADRTIRVVNALGSEVSSVQYDGNTTAFNAHSLADGVYSFILKTKTGAFSVPFTVVH